MDGPSFQLRSQELSAASSSGGAKPSGPKKTEQDLEQLFRRFYPFLRRFFAAKGCPPDIREDLIQDTFVRLCQSLDTFEGRSKVRTWLYTVARNLWLNTIRDGANRVSRQQEPLDEESAQEEHGVVLESKDKGPAERLLAKERLDVLRAELDKLPPRMRRCARLRLVQERKYREIADLEQITIDAVKGHLGEARKRLDRALKAHFNGAGLDQPDEESK